MHRSGTSALTAALNSMGAFVGDEDALTGKNWENPVGFFERKDMRAICDSTLHACGAEWWKVANFDAERVPHSVVQAKLPEMQAVVSRLNEGAGKEGVWVAKEPRLCFLYPILQRVLLQPQLILAVRHPVEVAKSLRHRNGFTLAAGLALWEAYTAAAIRSSTGNRHVIVNYDNLVSDPSRTLSKLAGDLEAQGTKGLDPDRGAQGILTNLRRETVKREYDHLLTPAQAQLWECLRSGALPDEKVSLSEQGRETLLAFEVDEATRKALEAEIRSLRQQVQNAKLEANRADKLALDVASQTAAKDTLQKQLAVETEKSQALETQLKSLAKEISSLKHQVSTESERAGVRVELEKQLSLEARKSKALETRAKSLAEEVQELKNQIRIASARAAVQDELEKQLDLETRKSKALDSRAKSLAEEAQELKNQVRIQAEQILAMEEKARTYAGKLREADESLRRLTLDLAERQEALNDVRKQCEQLKELASKAKTESSGLKQEIDVLAKRYVASQNIRAQITRSFRWKAGGAVLAPLIPIRIARSWLSHRTDRMNRLLIEASDLFDRRKYLEQNPDLADSGQDPLNHYLASGWREGREPGPNFFAKGYLATYPDVAILKTNPLLHYLKHGKAEGRNPKPRLTRDGKPASDTYELVRASGLFDEGFYLSTYSDIKAANIDALEHYLANGWTEGRDPGPKFSTLGYFQLNPDVAAASINPLVHYLTNGKSEGRGFVSRTEFASEASRGGTGSSSPPDLFDLRAAARKARAVLVMNASDHEALDEVLRQLDSMLLDADVVVTHPNTISLLPNPVSATPVSSIFALAYPGNWAGSKVLMHLINNGPLADYESVLWIRNITKGNLISQKLDVVLPPLLATGTDNRNLISESFDSFPIGDHADLRRAIGTIFARLGRRGPQGNVPRPSGNIIGIPALVISQLKAYSIKDKDFADSKSHDQMLVTLIGAIADEADLVKVQTGKSNSIPLATSTGERTIKAIAFYLPQFHPIDENDRWWGKGFTEWTNVTKARPLFRFHYQPQLPADLGFYDLRLPQTQLAQANLAQEHGLHGFCYYYYWFDGKKVLNEPIERMLESGIPDYPFCVCWANENWSRNWDGQNRHVLLEQHYSEESNRALIHEFIKLMRDPRYIRHNGKPVLLVYRVRIIPNWLETARMWRDECRKAGIGEIHLCAVRFGLEPLDGHPSEFGLDSFVLFPPHESEKVDARSAVRDLAKDFNGTILDYDTAMLKDLERFEDGYEWPVHRGVMLGWDNTARRPRDSRIFLGSTPARLHRWLKGILSQESRHNEDRESLIFINAWNEWAEGTMLEPSTRFGRGYLQALRSAISPIVRPSESPLPPEPFDETLLQQHVEARVQTKWFDGAASRKDGAPTVLVCAHVVSHQLFGAERSFLDVLDAFGKLDLNIIVALPTDVHTYYVRLCQERSCGVSIIPYTQWRDNREPDSRLVSAFRSLISQRSIDLVYANTIVLLEPLVAARNLGRKTIVHARELVDRDEGLVKQIGLDAQSILEKVSDLADGIVANSEETRHLFQAHGKTFCVPNIIHPDELDIANEIGDRVRIVMASSNIPKKGLTDFIAVARKCETSCPDAEFVLVGPENAHTKALKEGGLPSNVVFAGYADSPAKAMASGNVVLSLSHFAESFGRTVAEAQAARRPVIAYDWGAIPELIEDGETGLLAPYLDIDAVCDHVRTLCGNPQLISRLGEAGRARMLQGYTPEVLADGLWRAIESTLEASLPSPEAQRPVTIVVPVFNAFEAVRACLDALKAKAATLPNTRILMLDDASTDERIAPLLATFEQMPNFHLHTNAENKGYTRTINIGIQWADRDDVVLLNSDAVVTDGWLAGLKRAAYSSARVATATAMSDNAGAFSFPIQNEANPKPEDMSFDDFAGNILMHTAHLQPVNVPTGSGFCMYIRRDALDKIGLFDEEAFPRGYGEENDFCMRAIGVGLRNVISPYSYVFHVRSASFGAEKERLIVSAVNTVTRRYPDYARLVREAFASADMQELRQASWDGVYKPSRIARNIPAT